MMEAQDQLAIARSCLSLALIAFAMVCMRRRTNVDRYRESLFTLRDGLFDYMWKNDVSFDLPAYRLMRAFLNGAIRCAGEITPTTFIVGLFAIRSDAPAPGMSAAIDEIEDPDVRERFRRTLGDFVEVTLVFLGPIGVLVRWAVKLDRFKRAVRTQVDRWIGELVVFGSEDSVARQLFAGRRARLLFRR